MKRALFIAGLLATVGCKRDKTPVISEGEAVNGSFRVGVEGGTKAIGDGTGPCGSAPYGTSPYGMSPYGTASYGSSPYGMAPYGSSPYGSSPYGVDPRGFYRSSSLGPDNQYAAWIVYFNSGGVRRGISFRQEGRPVCPVKD